MFYVGEDRRIEEVMFKGRDKEHANPNWPGRSLLGKDGPADHKDINGILFTGAKGKQGTLAYFPWVYFGGHD